MAEFPNQLDRIKIAFYKEKKEIASGLEYYFYLIPLTVKPKLKQQVITYIPLI